MKRTLTKFWISVKRNPVINGYLIAIALQIYLDYTTNNIDFAHILGYLATVVMSVAVREFTVPLSEHLSFMKQLTADAQNRAASSYLRGVEDGETK